MADREKVITELQILRTWCAVNPEYNKGLCIEDCRSAVEWLDNALALLKAQEPKIESRAKVPCICGSRKRETWLGDAGWQFKCMKCGRRSPWGKTEKEAIQNWNKMIEGMRVKQDGN
jgi:hypothetical protein